MTASASRIALAIPLALALAGAADAKHRPHAPATRAGPLRAGSYVCQGEGSGLFPLTILPGSRYRAGGAPGSYAVTATTLRFTGGSLANNVGTMEGLGAFSLTLSGAPAPYTHCTRAKK